MSPLNSARLATALKVAIKAAIPSATEVNPVTEEADLTLQNACEALAEQIVDEVVANLQIQIPAGAVIVSVTGGSGAPAVGTPNAAPITCTVA